MSRVVSSEITLDKNPKCKNLQEQNWKYLPKRQRPKYFKVQCRGKSKEGGWAAAEGRLNCLPFGAEDGVDAGVDGRL